MRRISSASIVLCVRHDIMQHANRLRVATSAQARTARTTSCMFSRNAVCLSSSMNKRLRPARDPFMSAQAEGHKAKSRRIFNPFAVLAISRESSPQLLDDARGELLARPRSNTDSLLFRFIVPQYVTSLGEHLKVVGSLPELGTWQLSNAPTMRWCEGHKWVLETLLPKTSEFEFKVVAVLGHDIRWEQGVNRVVQTGEEVMDVAVELVINLTCSFDYTQNTGLELALDRTSIQESFELASATLELLQKRRSRLVRQLHETTQTQGPELAEQQAEAARLDAAVNDQTRSLDELSNLVSNSTISEDGKSLMLSVPGSKVELPRGVGLLSHAHSAISLALGHTMEAAKHLFNSSPAPQGLISNGTTQASEPTLDDDAYQEPTFEPQQVRSQSPGASWDATSSDSDLEPDDAAAAMAAAAYASLSSTRRPRRKKGRRAVTAGVIPATNGRTPSSDELPAASISVDAQTDPAPPSTTNQTLVRDEPRIDSPDARSPEAETPTTVRTAWRSASGSPLPVELPVDLPPPKQEASGALFFSADLLSAITLPPPPPRSPPRSEQSRSQSRAKLAVFFGRR